MRDSTSTNPDEWNLNEKYLFLIMDLIVKYNEAKLNDDFEMMHKTLDCMESTLFPKLEKDKVEENLNKIGDNIEIMQKKDENGRMLLMYPKLVKATKKLMDDTYKLLLVKMEDKGMLTKRGFDPRHAMGRMGGS